MVSILMLQTTNTNIHQYIITQYIRFRGSGLKQSKYLSIDQLMKYNSLKSRIRQN